MGQSGSIGQPEKKNFDVGLFLKTAKDGDVTRLLWCLRCKNSDVNATNTMSLSALHLAAKEGHVDVIRELISQNADLNQRTKRGNTPLHIAAIHGQCQVVRLLVENGAHVNVKCKYGYTPLYLAVTENHTTVVELLLSHGADKTLAPKRNSIVTPLQIAELQGNKNIVQIIKDKKVLQDQAQGLPATPED